MADGRFRVEFRWRLERHLTVDQYTYQKLRGRLRGAATVDPCVRDVCCWRTDQVARARIAASPQAHAKAAAKVIADVATEDQIVDVLGPCFLAPLGEMRLRLAVREAIAEMPKDPEAVLREKNSTLAGALLQLMAKCEAVQLLTVDELAFYKKVLES